MMKEYRGSSDHITLLILVLILNLGCVTSQQSCTVEDAVACVQAAVGSGSGVGRFPGLTVQGTAENCGNIYGPAVVCLQDVGKTCGTSLDDVEVQEWAETTSKILTYICSEQGLRVYPCVTSAPAVVNVTICGLRWNSKIEMANTSQEACSSVYNYRECLRDAVTDTCGLDAAEYVDDLILIGVKQVVEGRFPTCKINFTDPMSETENCSPNPCQNGGTCTLRSGRPGCSCPQDFDGMLCEQMTTSDSGVVTPSLIGYIAGVIGVFLVCV